MKFVVSLVAIALVGSAVFVVLLELFVGGGGTTEEQARGGRTQQPKEERTGEEKANKEPENLDWAAGVVLKAAYDKRAVVIRPDDGGPRLFTYKPESLEVTLDGEEVGRDAIDEGQRVSIGYKKVTTKKDREVNLARSVELQSEDGSPGDQS